MTDASQDINAFEPTLPDDGDVPKYRLLQDSFFAPRMLLAGSIVGTHAPPGNHMQPLNAAAERRLEDWYHEEYDEFDEKGKKTGQKVKPHLKFKIQRYEPGVVHSVDLLAEPKPDDMTNSLSLAGASANVRPDTDQRPGPAPVPEAVAVKEQSGAEIVEVAERTGPAASVKVK